MKNLFAHTVPHGTFPDYVSLNQRDDGALALSIRDKGVTGTVVLTTDQLQALADGINAHMATQVLSDASLPRAEAASDRA